MTAWRNEAARAVMVNSTRPPALLFGGAMADHEPGPIERATLADIQALGDRVADRQILVFVALRLARAMDELPQTADAAKITNLAKELRAASNAMRGIGDDDAGQDAFEAWVARITRPVPATARDTEDQPADARRRARRSSGGAG